MGCYQGGEVVLDTQEEASVTHRRYLQHVAKTRHLCDFALYTGAAIERIGRITYGLFFSSPSPSHPLSGAPTLST